ncbi:MAG: polysaccharide biosynthesis/export family protein, partial [Kiritimatiellae bacterium]|nr:polysaccharide biosynthesis/export family protein [Kiritimatiellia bacterium]
MPALFSLGRWPLAIALLAGMAFTALAQGPEQAVERRILAGDRLNVSVREQPDMSRIYPVAGDGSIDFGFAGRVIIAELTPDEAAHRLEGVLESSYFNEANVTVSIANFVEGDVLLTGAL